MTKRANRTTKKVLKMIVIFLAALLYAPLCPDLMPLVPLDDIAVAIAAVVYDIKEIV